MSTTLYKFLRTGLKSQYGNHTWKLGECYEVAEDLVYCNKGFHGSVKPLDALSYVPGEIIALVEVEGKNIIHDDKQCWSKMRIVDARKWTKKTSVELAIFAAEQVIGFYEERYPNDTRPSDAIKAAKAYLEDLSDAANAVRAAHAANAAAYAARAVARAAAEAAEKVNEWMVKRFDTLETVK